MKLQDRDLSIRMRGEDVALLQRELGQLINAGKLDIQIDQSEITREYFGASTRQAVMAFQQQHGLTAAGAPPTGIVDEPTARAINAEVDALQSKPFSVNGYVVKPDGTPIARYIVKAYDHGTCKAVELGNSVTDGKGYYKITYTSRQLSYEGKQHADLMVRVFESRTAEEAVVSSPLILNARPEEEINLVVGEEPYRGPSEFAFLSEKLVPELNALEPDCITGRDVIVLANKTGIAAKKVAWFVKANRLEQTTEITSEVFYGLFQQQLPTGLPALVSQDMDVIRRALETAADTNFVSRELKDRLDDIVNRLKDQIVEKSLPDREAPDDKASLKGLLNTAGLSSDGQRSFLKTYVQNDKPMNEFWRDMREQMGDDQVEKLQFTIQLSAVTHNHLPLVKTLQAREDVNDARDLAKFGIDDLLEIIDETGMPGGITGDTPEEQEHNYARTITRIIEDAFPTAVIARGVMQDDGFDNENFKQFFTKNPDFEFSDNVRKYLARNPDALDGIDNPGEFEKKLEAVQRLYRLIPGYEKYDAIKLLSQNNIHSAHTIKRMGKSAFIRNFSSSLGGGEKAQTIYNNAGKVSALSLVMLAKYSYLFNNIGTYVFPPNPLPEETLDGTPDLKTLFGSLDFCECKHCRSVLSPAAYLVDLLDFLNNAKAEDNVTSVLAKLFERRPDLGNIQLTCENTNTPVPYIDLVNEVLENAVVPYGYDLQTETDAETLETNPEHINAAAYDELGKAKYPWSLPFSLWREEARVYLNHLGVPRYRLLEIFHKDGTPPGEIDVATEYLDMTKLEREIVTGNDTANLWDYYGLGQTEFDQSINKIPTLLKQSQLEFEGLVDLLKTRFVNPDGKKINFDEGPCALEGATVTLTNKELDKLHRCRRLQEKLSWTVIELDKAVTALQPADIDDDFIIRLSYIKRLQGQLRVPLIKMLSWWSLMDTAGYEDEISLYEQLFLDKTVNNPLEEIFKLNSTGDELDNPNNSLLESDGKLHHEYAPVVSGALNINADDLLLLIHSELPNANLNLANLSHIHRLASFTKSLKIGIDEYLSLKALTGKHALTEVNPAAIASPKDTLDFIDCFTGIRKSGLKIAELGYLLRHNYPGTSTIPPSDAAVAVLLEEMRTGLKKIAVENVLMENFVMQKLATTLSIEAAVAESLLKIHLPHPTETTQKAIQVFLAATFVQSDPDQSITREAFVEQFDTYELLFKIAMIINKLSIHPEQLDFLLEKGPGLGWYDLKQLPLTTVDHISADDFDSWTRLVDAFEIQETSFRRAKLSIFKLLEKARQSGVTAEEIHTVLSENTGWSKEDIKTLAGTQYFNFEFTNDPSNANDYRSEQWLRQLRDAFDILRRIGIDAAQTWSWNEPVLTSVEARAIKNACKAKYGNDKWLEIAPPLRDTLREKQREALQAFVIYNEDLEDAENLYSHYLVDTEMSSCAKTSRIKLANSSIQLFVQRILMNLEDGIEFTRDMAEEWKWRKYYRVWEANRKVFLWPENWIEPELRDDKSPFFQDLENELLQGEINAENVERAYLNYLRKLDEVARLEISGLYKDEEQNILHVFGRTRGIPPIYYYRKWVNNAFWTPWEKIYLDIEGDHLIPVVYNRRLYLFWPKFTPKGEENYEIQMAWSENKDGKWSAKKVSSDIISGTDNTSKVQYIFYYVIANNILYIQLANTSGPEYEITNFKFNDCDGELLVHRKPSGRKFSFVRPTNSEIEFMKFREPAGKTYNSLELPEKIEYMDTFPPVARSTVLNATPGQFLIAYSHQDKDFLAQRPFFYEDDLRTFFVVPKTKYQLQQAPDKAGKVTLEKNSVGFGTIDIINETYWQAGNSVSQIVTPVDQTTDLSPGKAKRVFTEPDSFKEYFHVSDNMKVINRNASIDKTDQYQQGKDYDISTDEMDKLGNVLGQQHGYPVLPGNPYGTKYYFHSFYHPYVCLFIKHLNRYGIEGLLNPVANGDGTELQRQLTPNHKDIFKFYNIYKPNVSIVRTPYPVEDIDFEYSGAYSLYNWELFFHTPLLVATRLSQNQRFEEAQKWFHYIFNPTETDGNVPERFWKIKPFFQLGKKTLDDLDKLLKGDEELEKQVGQWQDNPFQPHLIARLRIAAYMKTVVMKYIDNLVAWGDHLFRRDTIESINEATQLYVLAAQILGRRPVMIKGKELQPQAFDELLPALTQLGNAWIDVESQLPVPLSNGSSSGENSEIDTLNTILYFCIPKNDKLLSYWDTVADRLFKIRHCMNIEGVLRQLPLFEPPIDPGLLVKAVAAGVDLSSALNDLYAPLPHYRFQFMLQKAVELCNDVKSLGAALLSALEKRDAEKLSLLRAGHEVQLLKAVKDIKKQNIKEAEETLNSLNLTKEVTNIRLSNYRNREFINPKERLNFRQLAEAHDAQDDAAIAEKVASIMHILPDISWPLGPGIPSASFGGSKLGAVANAVASFNRHDALGHTYRANKASINASYERRQEDWDLQIEMATKELEQNEKQIAAAEIRKAIAEKDLKNHELQTENAKEVERYMKYKFTNQQLYNWMISQVSSIYFQGYQMAYDLAKRAEKAFRHELAIEDTNFIRLDYWDNLKKGLLAGERLHKDLKRMEVAYLEQNKREYELTKHVSLAMLNPEALLKLRETGECSIDIPEILFDLDYPGQYLRRIKSVSLTIPCVTGPYTNVSCKLTLLGNKIRVSTDTTNGYAYDSKIDPNGKRFREDIIGIQSIATSGARNDSGMFQLNFRDERYLPFEGAGAVSSWGLELPKEYRQFDYDTIPDVIIHINYTAREGGDVFKDTVNAYIRDGLNKLLDALAETETGLLRLFSMKQEFSNELHQFLYPPKEQDGQEADIIISKKHFPYYLKDKTLQFHKSRLILKLRDEFKSILDVNNINNVKLWIEPGNNPEQQFNFTIDTELGNMASAEFALNDILGPGMSTLKIKLAAKENDIQGFPTELFLQEENHYRINREAVEDIYLLINYTLT